MESLRHRVRNDDFDKNAPAPEDPKVQKLINEAEKQLFLGRKDTNVAAYPPGKVGTMIQSGSFDQKMDEIRKDQAYVADLPRLKEVWKNERMVRRARTRQICDRKIAEMTAKGTWPTEAVKKQQAKQAAKNSGGEKNLLQRKNLRSRKRREILQREKGCKRTKDWIVREDPESIDRFNRTSNVIHLAEMLDVSIGSNQHHFREVTGLPIPKAGNLFTGADTGPDDRIQSASVISPLTACATPSRCQHNDQDNDHDNYNDTTSNNKKK